VIRLQAQHLLVGSKLEKLIAIDNRLEMNRFMAQISTTAESEKRDLENLIAQRDAYDKEWYAAVLADMQTTQPLLDQAKENLKKARLHARLVELRADQDAIVMSVAPVSVGSVMQPGQQFLTLVPADAPLELEVDVLGSDAGFLRVGNHAMIKFDAFNYILYGYAEGTVRTVSPDSAYQPGAPISYTAPSMGSGQPVATAPQGVTPGATPYFVTRISLDAMKLRHLPEGFHITPGMPATTDIKVGTRTIVQYMFSRIAPIPLESMREP
jgi:HlyD family secretion protein